MRLIDADKLAFRSVWGLTESEAIENAPTVEAIPARWIFDYCANCEYCEDDKDGYAIMKMLAIWLTEGKNEVD